MDQTENGNLRGIVLMVVSMAAFAIEDSFIKRAADDMPTGQILLMLGVFGAAIFTVMAARAGQKPFSRDLLQGQVMLRNLGEVIGTMGFVTAIALTPLTSATAILQAMPLAVTLGAALFLGESVGWRRWTAILVGFAGVLVIIRPGLEGFDINSLWAVLAVFGLAIRDLATRRVPARIGSMSISVSGFVSVAILGAAMLALSGGAVWPGTLQTALMVGALSAGVVGYWMVVEAMRVGEISAVTPFRYARLIFALIIGILIFGERPDVMTLAGATLVIGSGLYTFARERMRRRNAARAEAISA